MLVITYEKIGLKHFEILNVFIENSDIMNDFYKNIDVYNP